MKIKVLSRSAEECTRERACDLARVFRNPDPALHPFERAREYTRSLNAAKLDRVFAKPFLRALSGHSDGVFSMAKNTKRLNILASGACDGEIRVWTLSDGRAKLKLEHAHAGFVRGLTFTDDGQSLLSCGDDKLVKLWDAADSATTKPTMTYMGDGAFMAVDHSRDGETFATSSSRIDVWSLQRSKPIHQFNWGVDTVHCVRYNPVQTNVVASTGSDRSVTLYDVRLQTPVLKVVLQMCSGAIAWNPREAFNFTVANEDHNLYSFDMRKFHSATNVHKDHASAVLDVDYSPTGEEFVSGSYDRTLRIFNRDEGHSREVYHTKRMQRLFCVKFAADARYVLSGSDDTNIRLWKAQASESMGIALPRQKAAQEYGDTLKKRYGHMKQVRRILKHRHVPKVIMKMGATKTTMQASNKRKMDNIRRHTAPAKRKNPKSARRAKIVTVVE